ncbi:GDSL-type esterase/lipase family protein [Sanguibacter massiliensis]|uniref:GDSL-type esterase/lipase family protein n=1 Tax=Sanguibacter massiliensis TaxID=1973217 RepID=UPI001F5DCE7D|nr:GDSL-type esterase/lipase family protein [Sanguibacter massiliensis]
MTRKLRIVVVGDELAAGVGDPRALGWVGRVVARTTEVDVEHYVLAVPGETSTTLSARWEAETEPRLTTDPDVDQRLVVALGRHDLTAGLSVARSRLNLANILDVAEARHLRTLVVGPPPGTHDDGERLADLSRAYGDVAQRRRVPYVETFTPLVNHDQWHADLAGRGDDLPQQAGYGLMAWLVLHSGWHHWLGLADPDA